MPSFPCRRHYESLSLLARAQAVSNTYYTDQGTTEEINKNINNKKKKSFKGMSMEMSRFLKMFIWFKMYFGFKDNKTISRYYVKKNGIAQGGLYKYKILNSNLQYKPRHNRPNHIYGFTPYFWHS